jgi:hypothetical protein
MIGLFPTMSQYVFRQQVKMVVDSSMATTLTLGLVVAVLCASHTVTREMKNGTVLLLLSKPVRRWNFVLAKISGIIAALSVFVFLCNLGCIVSLRIAKDQFRHDMVAFYFYYGLIVLSALIGGARNYFTQVSFVAATINQLLIIFPLFILVLYFVPVEGKTGFINFEVIPALILIFFAVWAMGAITVTLSTRLDLVANLTVCSIIFLLGLISNYFIGKESEASYFWKLVYALVPNWQFFWMADALASNTKIPYSYIAWSFVYVVLYIGNLNAESTRTGNQLKVKATLTAESGYSVLGLIPAKITITNPDGQISDLSHFSAFSNGSLTCSIPVAYNQPKGKYQITIKELASGKHKILFWNN